MTICPLSPGEHRPAASYRSGCLQRLQMCRPATPATESPPRSLWRIHSAGSSRTRFPYRRTTPIHLRPLAGKTRSPGSSIIDGMHLQQTATAQQLSSRLHPRPLNAGLLCLGLPRLWRDDHLLSPRRRHQIAWRCLPGRPVRLHQATRLPIWFNPASSPPSRRIRSNGRPPTSCCSRLSSPIRGLSVRQQAHVVEFALIRRRCCSLACWRGCRSWAIVVARADTSASGGRGS